MEFRFTPEQEAFRLEIRDFLKRELPPEPEDLSGSGEVGGQVSREFSKKLAAKGWIGLAWPREHGGRGLGYIERFIYNEEMVYHRAPTGFHHTAERQMGPSIIINGSDYQRRTYLPPIAAGEIAFGIGYSEPNAGSDLAGLQTAAVQDGDDYVINGQKIYTSGAHYADYIFLATRTDPNAPKHRGISVFVVPTNAPGLEVQPLWTMAGTRFNQIFFNGVRVNAREMVGERNQGWYVVAANLDFERSGIERVTGNLLLFEDVLRYCRETRRDGRSLMDDPVTRNRLAELAIEFTVGRMLAYRVSWLQSQGRVPNYEASMSKVYGSELTQRVAQAAMQVLGLYGPVQESPRWAKLRARGAFSYLLNVSNTIAGGTSEIQRNVVATRGLGMPR